MAADARLDACPQGDGDGDGCSCRCRDSRASSDAPAPHADSVERRRTVDAPRAAPATSTSAAPSGAPPPPRPVAPPISARQRWNVFDLQNRARAIAGRDPARDEELSFLLLYLREFADIGGDLHEEFDTLVRESFPELLPT